MAQLLGFSCQPGTHQATYSLRFLSTALLAHTASGSSPAAGATKVLLRCTSHVADRSVKSGAPHSSLCVVHTHQKLTLFRLDRWPWTRKGSSR